MSLQKIHYQSFCLILFACVSFIENVSAQDVDCEIPCSNCFSSCRNSNRFYIQGEALYWRTTEDNTALAEKSSISINTAADFSSQRVLETTKRVELDFEWDPGVRVNVGFLFPSRQWDVDFSWTHLVTKASKFVSAPDLSVSEAKGATSASGTILTPIWLASEEEGGENLVTLGNVSEIDANLHISFNNYEGTLGQTICSTPCFHLHVLCGPKYTRIAQRYHISYIRNLDPNGNISGAGSASQTIHTRFNGIGLQGGLQAEWWLGCGFSIYSSFTGGILYGHVHAHDKESTQTQATDNLEFFFETENNTDSVWVTRPNIDLALGLEWEYCFPRCYLLVLKAGWEYHNYFDQNSLRLATSNDPARGNLAFHGATFGMGLGF